MRLRRPSLLALVALPAVAAEGPQFTFSWPGSPRLCDVVDLTWSGGVPPFQAWLIPSAGQPFIYDISDSYYSNGSGSYPIQLQVSDGYVYTIMMNDANGLGTASGGTSEATIVQPFLSSSNTTALASQAPCLKTASQNSTSLDFTFAIAGQTVQCADGLEIQWTGGAEMAPYNITIIPMDQRYLPWDITLERGTSWANQFLVNMTAGTRFTMMMSSKLGYGRGGVADIYEVASSNTTSCISQPSLPTGSWPADATFASLDPATLPPSGSGSGSSDFWGDPVAKRGKIAGISVGVVFFCVLMGGALWWVLRRRRRWRVMNEKEGLESAFVDSSPSPRTTSKRGISSITDRGVTPFTLPSSAPTTPANRTHSVDLASLRDGQGDEPHTPASSAGSVAASGTSTEDFARLDTSPSGRRDGSGAQSRDPSSHLSPSTSLRHRPRSPSSTIAPFTSPSVPISTTTQSTSLHTQSDAQDTMEEEQDAGEEDKHQLHTGGSMRLTNPDADTLPLTDTHPLSYLSSPPPSPRTPTRRRARPGGDQPLRERTYRRHADAGRVPIPERGVEGAQGEVVDLPPLYSEVPRDGDIPGMTRVE
ncbi:hypothetical protein IAR50_004320 [Cryptococcus sp. DSM 104548]